VIEDSSQLRFLFEAPSLRQAGDLATALRVGRRAKVQIRHADPRHWTVIATTPPTESFRVSHELWRSAMETVASGHPGCRVVSWVRLDPEAALRQSPPSR
jgi:hypothetical protein